MHDNLQFTVALVMSVSIHCAALAPNPWERFENEAMIAREPIIVDYVVIQERLNAMIPEEKQTAIEIKKVEIVEQEAPKKEPQVIPQVEPKPAAQPQIKEVAPPDKVSDALKKIVEERLAAIEKKEKKSKQYIAYYGLIREKIRKQLEKNYKDLTDAGDVYVVFTLQSNGTLDHYAIDRTKSTKNKLLTDIAELSLMDASPFPKIPPELSQNKLTFNVIISFKKK